jgi:hypothetical protein
MVPLEKNVNTVFSSHSVTSRPRPRKSTFKGAEWHFSLFFISLSRFLCWVALWRLEKSLPSESRHRVVGLEL